MLDSFFFFFFFLSKSRYVNICSDMLQNSFLDTENCIHMHTCTVNSSYLDFAYLE